MEFGRGHNLVLRLPSKNKFSVIVVKKYAKVVS